MIVLIEAGDFMRPEAMVLKFPGFILENLASDDGIPSATTAEEPHTILPIVKDIHDIDEIIPKPRGAASCSHYLLT